MNFSNPFAVGGALWHSFNMLSNLGYTFCSPRGNVRVNGNKISAGRYEISVDKGQVTVKDTTNGKSFMAHGDPHLTTSDGDHMQFQADPITIDLLDGVKVTITPTPIQNGLALVDQVGVMQGGEGVAVTDISGNGPKFGSITNSAAIDRLHKDGTVLEVRGDVDDLFARANGREFVGSDPTQRFGEFLLDGIGGGSRYNFEGMDAGLLSSSSGIDLFTRLQLLLPELDRQMSATFDKIDAVQKKITENMSKKPEDRKPAAGEMEPETQLQILMAGMQRLQQIRQQLVETITNLSKTDHESKMAVVRNFRS